ncbi:hypothetical protein KDN24_06325 [Bacillus sp. Bva_UNVM-123]|uniref:hypothetical protein n=1 Tax=Bacillus sp. Bva_UNVM-123 TaxID=2829798 RepID=UPI00391F39A9
MDLVKIMSIVGIATAIAILTVHILTAIEKYLIIIERIKGMRHKDKQKEKPSPSRSRTRRRHKR